MIRSIGTTKTTKYKSKNYESRGQTQPTMKEGSGSMDVSKMQSRMLKWNENGMVLLIIILLC